MSVLRKLSRRGFLLGAGQAVAVDAAWPGIGRAMQSHGDKIAPNKASPNFNPDVELELVCRPDSALILQGAPTRVWRYVANLVKGPKTTLTVLPNSYLGPILRFATGQKIRIRLRNAGKPTDNAFIETFNGSLRDECLNVHWFGTLAEARRLIEAWRIDYNESRPHRALGNIPPSEYALRAVGLTA